MSSKKDLYDSHDPKIKAKSAHKKGRQQVPAFVFFTCIDFLEIQCERNASPEFIAIVDRIFK